MDENAKLLSALDEAIVEAEAEIVLDYAEERDVRLRAARALVVGPVIGAASWLVLVGGACLAMYLLS